MSALTLPTLILALSKRDDYDIRSYAKKEISKDFGAKTADILAELTAAPENEEKLENLSDESKKVVFKQLTEEAGLDELTANMIISKYEDACDACTAEKTVKEGLPIKSIMELYHSSDDFLIKKSKEYVIISYRMFVYSVMHAFYESYVSKYSEDLFQSGCTGLLKAMTNYDPDHSAFTTYSMFFVQHEMTDQINFYKGSGASTHYNNIQRKIKEARQQLMDQGYEATDMQVSIMTGLKLDVIKKEDQYLHRTNFVNLDDDDNSLELECGIVDGPEVAVEKKERYESLYRGLKNLPEDIRTILVMRSNEHTNEQIASVLGISAGRVKSKYNHGLEVLHNSPRLRAAYMETLSEAERQLMRFQVDLKISETSADEQLESTMRCMGDLPPMSNDGDEGFDDDLFW